MDYQLQINCQKYVHSSPECRSHISSSNDVVSTFYQSWRLLISSGTTFTNGINYKLPNWITWVCISWRSSFLLHTCFSTETLADIFCIFLIDNVLANSVNAFCPWQSVYSFLLPTLLPLSRVRNTIVGKTCQMSKEKESTRIDEWPLNNFLDATELSFNEKRQKSSKVFILVINLITSSNMPCLPSFMKINL